LQRNPDTRIVIFGDATMAPEELESPHGSLYHYAREARSSAYWLRRIAERFTHTVWLNPIAKTYWPNAYGGYTLNRIREIFPMEDMTLGGIKRMVERLSET
ncbi:MAG TPA: VWA containing CoxE family protein, partial [Candidatus Hydrogenedentes bacterium]|nr:VWA containing CoxE family protein [Candidatus Hydrogenedentota bacterium]